jgi:hypothetical protein
MVTTVAHVETTLSQTVGIFRIRIQEIAPYLVALYTLDQVGVR